MNRPHQYKWLCFGIVFLVLASFLKKEIEELNNRHNLSIETHHEDLSPELSFALSLGVFRSVLIDYLWMRASKLQQEKRFYEIVQLYDFIGKLQPRNGLIWAYMGWNMAYNISVELPPGLERWRWVQNGLRRLKFHGLKYNPENGLLYKEIAWIYGHKMGKNLDDSHALYKLKLAEQMMEVFEGYESAKEANQALQSQDLEEQEKAKRVRKNLKERYQMDLHEMVKFEDSPDFGPLDWRLPQVHAMYWSRFGLRQSRYGVRPVDLERICYQAMQHLLRQGRLVYLPATETSLAKIVVWPDERQVQPIHKMFLKQIKYFKEKGTPGAGVRSAYYYFLKEALEILNFAGREKLAEELFQEANRLFPNILNGVSAKDHIRKNLVKRIKEMSGDQVSALVSSVLKQYYWWHGLGYHKKSSTLLRYAQELWKLNVKINSMAARSINVSFQELKEGVRKSILEQRMFHPKVLNGLSQQ